MKETFIVHADSWPTVQKLSLEQRGALFSALMCYQRGEPLPDMDFATEMAFSFMASQMDRDNERYDQIVIKRKAAGKKGAEVRWDSKCQQMPASDSKRWQTMASDGLNDNDNVNVNDNDNVNIIISAKTRSDPKDQKQKKAVFRKPTLDQVKDYCKERNNNVDAERFVDYYESNGWKVGRSSMKDWKAAVRTWERNNGSGKTRSDRAVTAFEEWAKESEANT